MVVVEIEVNIQFNLIQVQEYVDSTCLATRPEGGGGWFQELLGESLLINFPIIRW